MSESQPSSSPRLPTLRILVMADLGIDAAEPIHLTRETFSGEMARLSPQLDLQVPNHLRPGARTDLACQLRFTDLESFHPEAVARAIPVMADLLAARETLADRSPEADSEAWVAALPESVRAGDLAEKLRAAPARGAGAADGRLDALLEQVDMAEDAGDPADAVIAEIDRRLTRQTAALCGAAGFANLETSWRGLAFLLEHTEPGGPVRIEILPAAKEDCLDVFFEHVFHDEYEGDSETPLSIVVLAYSFDRGPGDLDLLRNAARMGESLQTPFLASMGIGYWGLKRPALLASMPDPAGKTQGPEYAKWNRLRQDDSSLWLAFSVNRFLARPAYGDDEGGDGDSGFRWHAAAAGRSDAPLWGDGSWALAALASRAYADSGPRLPMAGVRLEGLRCRPYGRKGEPFAFPLEVQLSDRRTLELSDCGCAPLTARPGEDVARFSSLPTFHRPTRYDVDAATQASYLTASLPYQIFASQASNLLGRVAREIEPGQSSEDVQQAFIDAFTGFLAAGGVEDMPAPEAPDGEPSGDSGEPAEPPPPIVVEIADHPNEPRLREIVVRLRPLFRISGGEADLVLGTPVPR